MNLLPFVTFFLILFSLGSLLLLQERKASISESKSYMGYLNIDRQMLMREAESDFAKLTIKKKKEDPKSSPPKKKPRSFALNHRTKICVHPYSTVDIGPLAKKENPLLYETAAKLIRVLYEKTSLWREEKDWEYHLLDHILESVKKNPNMNSLNQLSFSDPNLGETFYKMIKGTQTYTLMASEGYPPLGNYLSLGEKNEKQAIRFCFSSYPVLIALFGQEIADTIIVEETAKRSENKNKYAPLKKEELQALLLKDKKNPRNFTDFENILSFSTESKQNSYHIYQDLETGLKLHKK